MKSKREFAILKALVRDWKRATSHPKIARMVILQKKSFRVEQVRACVLALTLSDGDVHRAVQLLSGHSPAWIGKFTKWCDRVKEGKI